MSTSSLPELKISGSVSNHYPVQSNIVNKALLKNNTVDQSAIQEN